jgi:hypothetical protein
MFQSQEYSWILQEEVHNVLSEIKGILSVSWANDHKNALIPACNKL